MEKPQAITGAIKRIAHVCLSTANLDETILFYKRHFAARVIHEFRNSSGNLYGVFLRLNNFVDLEFFETQESISAGNQFRHLCFEVGDIEAAANYFRTEGMKAEVQRGKTDSTLQFWLTDPNGMKIEFHQYDDRSLLKE